MGHAACALGCAVGHSMTDIAGPLDSKPPWIHEMLRSGDAQAAAAAPMWWRWRCVPSSHLGITIPPDLVFKEKLICLASLNCSEKNVVNAC